MPQIDNTSEKVQNMLKANGIVEELQSDVTKLQSDVGDRSGRNLNLTEQVDVIHRRQDGHVSGSLAVTRAERDKNWNLIHETYATIDSLMKKSPLILSLKQDTTTKEYQIVNSNEEQVLFNEIFTEAQSRPVYCYAKDNISLLPLTVLNSKIILFSGKVYAESYVVNWCEIQYQYSSEGSTIEIYERPLIVPDIATSIDDLRSYANSAPSLRYLMDYVSSHFSSFTVQDKYINNYPGETIKSNETLDTCYGEGLIYRLNVHELGNDEQSGYGWLFVNYMDIPEHNWSQILIDLDGEIYSRYMNLDQWTEWQPIGSGGGTNITVDTELDNESTNPVQNKVITDKLNSLKYYGDMNIVPTDSSLFDCYFDEDELTVEIYGFLKEENIEELVIPYEIKKDGLSYRVNIVTISPAFENNVFLKTVVFPSSLDAIGDTAFKGCTNLERVVFSKGNTQIWAETFGNCTKLKSITLPNTIKVIQERAFDGSGLTDVYYEGTKEQWESINISEDNETLLNANIHFNWVATETYTTKGELIDYTKVWVQGRNYLAGDMVIAQVANENATGFYTVVLVCIQDHVASSDWILPTDDELFSERWTYNSDYALRSKFDDKGNDIAGTYATKEEVGDISTALDAIIALDNKLLGVSE